MPISLALSPRLPSDLAVSAPLPPPFPQLLLEGGLRGAGKATLGDGAFCLLPGPSPVHPPLVSFCFPVLFCNLFLLFLCLSLPFSSISFHFSIFLFLPDSLCFLWISFTGLLSIFSFAVSLLNSCFSFRNNKQLSLILVPWRGPHQYPSSLGFGAKGLCSRQQG